MIAPLSAPIPAIASRTVAGILDYRRVPDFLVAENSRILQRYEYLERGLLRLMAGWIPGVARWEAKFLVSRLVWEDAEHVQALRQRILELRTSERLLDRAPNPNLALVLQELVLSEDWKELFSGTIVVKRALLAAYGHHLEQTQPLVDHPTTRVLRILIAEEREHISAMEEQLSAGTVDSDRERLTAWDIRIKGLLDAAAGVQGIDPVSYTVRSEELRAGKQTFRCDHSYTLDERFQQRQIPRFLPGQAPSWDDAPSVYRNMALSRFAEMQAAMGLALSIYENDGQPWEYYYVQARYLWDETRHSAMGMAMLEDQGVDWTKIPHFVGNFHFYAALTPLERSIRLGILIELNVMENGHKRREVEVARKNHLPLAEAYQDYDWADEVNHVDFARRVIDMMTGGDAQLVQQKVEEIPKRYAEFCRPWEEQGATF